MTKTDDYISMAICCGFMFFVVLLAACLRLYLARQNKKWDVQYGPRNVNINEKDSAAGEENDGPNFRNVL